MKKILVVITTGFVPYGGLTSVMMNYWRAMDKSGIRFDFASTNDPPQQLIDEIEKEGCSYFKLPPRKKLLSYFNSLKKLSKGYDVVHVHGNSSTSVLELAPCKAAGVPLRIVHNHNSVSNYPLLNKILRFFFRRSYTHAIACSQLAGDWLFGKGNFRVLRNAIDVDKFTNAYSDREKCRKELNVQDDDFVIGHVGKFNEQKNYPKIISIFSDVCKLRPNSKLLLVGEGSLFEWAKDEVKRLSIEKNVLFVGRRTDIPYLMSGMDAFLFPSLWEGLPLSALEAQASGLPVYLSDAISEEVVISDNVSVCKLSDDSSIWAKNIINGNGIERLEQIKLNGLSLTKAGYNIKTEANNLLDIYLS